MSASETNSDIVQEFRGSVGGRDDMARALDSAPVALRPEVKVLVVDPGAGCEEVGVLRILCDLDTLPVRYRRDVAAV